MRSLAVTATLLLLALGVSVARTPPKAGCAFADEHFSTQFAITACIATYYAERHAWPSTSDQLRNYLWQVVRTDRTTFASPSRADVDTFFARFSRLQLTPQQKDLAVHLRYTTEGKPYSEHIIFHPGRTCDEIMEHMTFK